MANSNSFFPNLTDTNGVNPFSDMAEIFQYFQVFALIKGIFIVFLIGYIIAAAVIIKQIYLMTATIKSPTNHIIIGLGYANLIIAILIFVIVLFIS